MKAEAYKEAVNKCMFQFRCFITISEWLHNTPSTSVSSLSTDRTDGTQELEWIRKLLGKDRNNVSAEEVDKIQALVTGCGGMAVYERPRPERKPLDPNPPNYTRTTLAYKSRILHCAYNLNQP